ARRAGPVTAAVAGVAVLAETSPVAAVAVPATLSPGGGRVCGAFVPEEADGAIAERSAPGSDVHADSARTPINPIAATAAFRINSRPLPDPDGTLWTQRAIKSRSWRERDLASPSVVR